ncbi:MAG TPA: prepilin-type N-terminal cleavage/methylation domain-containing protein [Phycisphaerales bacterium]|nr:prepilin-type N-terminal cleavage/methylation domain-containing protein [Phycisphaerales bacterium]
MATRTHSSSRAIIARCGFTLLESMMAIGILLITVMAVCSAITAGQEHALEANQRIAATLAAEELMGRLTAMPYNSLASWDGFTESPGAMTTMHSDELPEVYGSIGRSVEIIPTMRDIDEVGVKIRGTDIHITAVNTRGRVMAELYHFIPEPQS